MTTKRTPLVGSGIYKLEIVEYPSGKADLSLSFGTTPLTPKRARKAAAGLLEWARKAEGKCNS